jgi:hypothetical protein
MDQVKMNKTLLEIDLTPEVFLNFQHMHDMCPLMRIASECSMRDGTCEVMCAGHIYLVYSDSLHKLI